MKKGRRGNRKKSVSWRIHCLNQEKIKIQGKRTHKKWQKLSNNKRKKLRVKRKKEQLQRYWIKFKYSIK